MTKQKEIKWVAPEERIGEMRNAYKILIKKSDGKISLGRPRQDGTMVLNWILLSEKQGLRSVNWIRLDQDRAQWRILMSAVMNIGFQKKKR
jgi:hypothetical protein